MDYFAIPRGWERLVVHGDRVEAGQVLAVSVPRGVEPDVIAPVAGFAARVGEWTWTILHEPPQFDADEFGAVLA